MGTMADNPPPDENVNLTATGRTAMPNGPLIVYIGFLLSYFTAGLSGIIALIAAYIWRGQASEVNATHYQFQIRTFWFGLVMSMIGLLATAVVIGWFIIIAVAAWEIVRCVKGLAWHNAGKPVPKPRSLLFGG